MTANETATPAHGVAAPTNPSPLVSTDAPDDTRAADIRDFLSACYGDLAGRAHYATPQGPSVSDTGKYRHQLWKEHHLAWPEDGNRLSEIIAAQALLGDVYCAPYLMHARHRTPGAVVARILLHVDVDDEVDPQRVIDLGGFAVSSGTRGGAHIYVPLSQPITGTQHALLEDRLRTHFAADSKISTNDLMRPPGTLNFKPTVFAPGAPPAPVTWLVRPSG